MNLSSLHIYPVKACGGIQAMEWELDIFGFRYDRRWMVVTPRGLCLTQRDYPRLALIRLALADTYLSLDAPGMSTHRLDPSPARGEVTNVQVWDDVCTGWLVDSTADRWFTSFLGAEVRLAWMPPVTIRPADPQYVHGPTRVSFADAFPFLLIGAASLLELNRRLDTPLPMNRFRPNLVVSGAPPFAEDGWRRIRIGSVEFEVVKPCARCMVTTLDQQTATGSQEPLRTLATYRGVNGEVMFGQNAIHLGQGRLRAGDTVEALGNQG